MPFFKGKEDMGLEASLKLLDLAPDATIEDANQAYTYLHQMIDLFYKDAGSGDGGSREEDMDLLTCAYEKAVAYLSDSSLSAAETPADLSAPSTTGAARPTDLHFTINFPAGENPAPKVPNDDRLPDPDNGAVEDAISITERRLRQVEGALPGAQEAVESAVSEVDAAGRRHTHAIQARINAVVAAKSAKSRALLLEIEAKRTMDEAIAAAERARDRVTAARKAAQQAKEQAQTARQKVARIRQSEETAAAELICAEDSLDQKKALLQSLTHSLLQTRNQMKMLQGTTREASIFCEDTGPSSVGRPHDDPDAERQQILSDLLEIEACLQAGKPGACLPDNGTEASSNRAAVDVERRQHPRMVYPPDRCPVLSIDGRSISVLDISSAGLKLMADDAMAGQRIVRGSLTLGGGQTLNVAGKVVRKDHRGLGVKLVTRIGRRILDQERMRLSA